MIYFDSSALVKLVIAEPHSEALVDFVADRATTPQVSSELAVTELRRTLLRIAGPPAADAKANEVLSGLILLPVTRNVLEYAAALPGKHLRSVDAIHLASALRLRSGLTEIVTYDVRMADAAREAGVAVATPA